MIKRILVALLLLSPVAVADSLPPLQLYCAGAKVGTKFKWNIIGATCAASGTVTGAYDVTAGGSFTGLTGVSAPLGGLGTLVSPLTCATCVVTTADVTFTTGAARTISVAAAGAAHAGYALTIAAGAGTETGDRAGGSLYLRAGAHANAGANGTLYLGDANTLIVNVGTDLTFPDTRDTTIAPANHGSTGVGAGLNIASGACNGSCPGGAFNITGGAGSTNGANVALAGGQGLGGTGGNITANGGAGTTTNGLVQFATANTLELDLAYGASAAPTVKIGQTAVTTTTMAGTVALPTTLTIGGSATIGDLPYWSAAGTVSRLAGGAAGTLLKGNGAGVAPSYTTSTFADAYTTGDILHATGANTVGILADVAVGQVHVSGGVGAISSYTGSPLLYTNSIGVGTGHAAAGVTLENTTAATNVMEQHSPALELSGETWNGAVTKKNSWWIQNRPYTGNTPGNLFFSQNDYAGGTTTYDVMRIQRTGITQTYVVGVNTSLVLAGGNSATGITVNANGLTSANILAATDHAGTIGGVANRFIRAPYVMGTAIATTDVALGAGWAASGNAPSAVTGDDSAGTMTWTNGTVGAGLTVTLTFKATWGTSAVPFCTMKTASTTDTVPGNWDQTAVSATATTWTYDRAPTTGATWKVAYVCHFGR